MSTSAYSGISVGNAGGATSPANASAISGGTAGIAGGTRSPVSMSANSGGMTGTAGGARSPVSTSTNSGAAAGSAKVAVTAAVSCPASCSTPSASVIGMARPDAVRFDSGPRRASECGRRSSTPVRSVSDVAAPSTCAPADIPPASVSGMSVRDAPRIIVRGNSKMSARTLRACILRCMRSSVLAACARSSMLSIALSAASRAIPMELRRASTSLRVLSCAARNSRVSAICLRRPTSAPSTSASAGMAPENSSHWLPVTAASSRPPSSPNVWTSNVIHSTFDRSDRLSR